MKRLRLAHIWLTAALALCACEKLSGLDELFLKQDAAPGGAGADAGQPAQVVQSVSDPSGALGMDASTPRERQVMPKGSPEDASAVARGPDASLANRAAPEAPDAGVGGAGGPRSASPVTMSADAAVSVSAGDAGVSADLPVADGGVPRKGRQPADAGDAVDAGNPAPEKPACKAPEPGGAICSVAPQCGCDAEQSCGPVGDRVTCFTAGTAGANEACALETDCVRGYTCADGACLQLCDGTRPQCAGGTTCFGLFSSNSHTPIPGASACASNCDVLHPQNPAAGMNACGAGTTCFFSTAGTACGRTLATLGHGERCSSSLQCAPGYVCRDDGVCSKWCESSSDCPQDFSCNLDQPSTVGQRSLGLCKPNCLERTEWTCSLSTQCGCDAAHSCNTGVVGNKVVHICRPVGQVPAYGSCQYLDDCVRGSSCVSGECRPNCQSDYDCERYALCEDTSFDAAPSMSGGMNCTRPCDPAEPYRAHGLYGACAASLACMAVQDGYSSCRSGSLSGTSGVRCSQQEDCASGFECVGNSCAPYCRNSGECRAGACKSVALFARDVEWGYCDSSGM